MSWGNFQCTTFELTAPLRLPLYQENCQLGRELLDGERDIQTDGHREGYTTFVGPFDVIRDPCARKCSMGILVQVTKNSHSVSYERDY